VKHKGLILFFTLNELSAIALAATKGEQKAVGQSIIGAIALTVFMLILWLLVRVGLFRGLKFRHWTFMLTCLIMALAFGYYLGVPR
jgi:hypothetical protein